MTKLMYAAKLGGVLSGGEPGFALQCVQCGECLDKCPQHLDIPTLLEAVVEDLEGPDLKQKVGIANQLFANKFMD